MASPGLFFAPDFYCFRYIFSFIPFFIVDWSLYSVTWWRQGLEQFSPHHVTHSELFNKYGLAIKVPLVLYFSPLKMLYIDSIDALAFWTVLQISEEGKAWYEQNIQSIFWCLKPPELRNVKMLLRCLKCEIRIAQLPRDVDIFVLILVDSNVEDCQLPNFFMQSRMLNSVDWCLE